MKNIKYPTLADLEPRIRYIVEKIMKLEEDKVKKVEEDRQLALLIYKNISKYLIIDVKVLKFLKTMLKKKFNKSSI